MGAGLIWDYVHRSILDDLSDRFEVTAFCARSDKTRKKVAAQFPGAVSVKDYKHLVALTTVDAVVVLTPIPLNAPVAISSLRSGKSVFLEKPVATSSDEARHIQRAMRESGKMVYTLEQAPYNHNITTIKNRLRKEELGRPISFERANCNTLLAEKGADNSYGETLWRQRPKFPLGLLFDGGIHDLALLGDLFGEPKTFYARGKNLRPDFGQYDWTMTMIEYGSGVTGSYLYSGLLGNQANYLIVRCEYGTMHLIDDELFISHRDDKTAKPLLVDEANAYTIMWRHFAQCIRQQSAPYYSLERAITDIAGMEAIERSLRNGTVESLQL